MVWPMLYMYCKDVRRLVDYVPFHDRFSANCAKSRPVRGKLTRMAPCVPTFDVFMVDLTIVLEKTTTY